ncbi:MAG: class I tRNA ligase family protein, partial [Planctomycetes bacterium]|nr:class I tRNA ligase family protein [Planctomycetota bacterium]
MEIVSSGRERDSGIEGLREGDGSETSIPQSLNPSIPSPADFNYFFPTDVLTTGRGIITLWVARMVMMSLYFTKRVPFRHVYIHPILQDGQGRTMSKSLGNGVDPLDLIDQYGTDAMRFVLAQMATETQDIRVPVKPMQLPDGRTVNSSDRFELGRNFCNKLWQAATGFVLANLEGTRWMRVLSGDDLAVEDRWILSRLSACIAGVDRQQERYHFSEAANALYSFFWNDFCAWYIELVKPRIRPADGSASVVTDTANTARQGLIGVLD